MLEIGCGTGRLADALGEREGARVWAVDAAPEMVERARAIGVNARVARGESLPFKPGWFERVVLRMAVHLVDRPRVFAESVRCSRPSGRLVVATEDPATLDDSWLARYFPSVPSVARGRFPDEGPLRDELVAAGFAAVAFERFDILRRIDREHALATMRAKAYSTFDLLPPDEYAAGLALAEAELPAAFDDTFRWLLAVADR